MVLQALKNIILIQAGWVPCGPLTVL